MKAMPEGISGNSTRFSWGGKNAVRRAMNILFDLDGTLTDPREGILTCFKYALDELQVESPADRTLEGMIGPPLRESFTALLGADDEERIDRAISLYRERFSRKGLYENALYPEISEALAQLREMGCSLFVATSKPHVFAQRIIDYFELGEFFRAIHGSELDGSNADKRDLLTHVLRMESLSATGTVMIGDRAQDILAARANGMSSIGVLWGYGSRQELAMAGADVLCEEPQMLVEAVSLIDDADRCVSVPSPFGRRVG